MAEAKPEQKPKQASKPRRKSKKAKKPAAKPKTPAPVPQAPPPVQAAREEKQGRGRPTDYDPAFCEQIIADGEAGYSVAAFAGKIGVARSTIYEWVKNHPEFSDAKKIAEAKSARFWELTLRKCAVTGKGNVTAAIFGLKNRAADDWKDRVTTELAGGFTVKDQRTHAEIAGAIAGKLARITTESEPGQVPSQPNG